MKTKKGKLIGIALVPLLAVAATLTIVYAANTPTGFPAPPGRLAYTVKFLCYNPSSVIPALATSIGLAPGIYYTDINIHNPSFEKSDITIVKEFVLATPEPRQGNSGSPIPRITANQTQLRYATLGPGAAMRIDCNEIYNVFPPQSLGGGPLVGGVPLKGFITIYMTKCSSTIAVAGQACTTPSQLNVWAEYSAITCPSNGPCSGPSLEMVQVQSTPFTP